METKSQNYFEYSLKFINKNQLECFKFECEKHKVLAVENGLELILERFDWELNAKYGTLINGLEINLIHYEKPYDISWFPTLDFPVLTRVIKQHRVDCAQVQLNGKKYALDHFIFEFIVEECFPLKHQISPIYLDDVSIIAIFTKGKTQWIDITYKRQLIQIEYTAIWGYHVHSYNKKQRILGIPFDSKIKTDPSEFTLVSSLL